MEAFIHRFNEEADDAYSHPRVALAHMVLVKCFVDGISNDELRNKLKIDHDFDEIGECLEEVLCLSTLLGSDGKPLRCQPIKRHSMIPSQFSGGRTSETSKETRHEYRRQYIHLLRMRQTRPLWPGLSCTRCTSSPRAKRHTRTSLWIQRTRTRLRQLPSMTTECCCCEPKPGKRTDGDDGHPLILINLHGRSARALIDTGAVISVMAQWTHPTH